MHTMTGRFRGRGDLELHYWRQRPEADPRAVVVMVHGVGEHSGRYANVVGPLVQGGYAVYGYDHRGHGLSPGPRVHVDRWVEYREDLAACLRMIAEQKPGRPVFLYGHSMGSLVVLDYLLERSEKPAGAIISGVATEPAGVGTPLKISAARLLTGVLPRVSVSLGIDAESLTQDPQALETYRADPLVNGRATIRWGTESLDCVERVKSGSHRVDVPLLVLHGEADPLNLASGARALFDTASTPRKRLRIYPGVRHEAHNDIGHERVAADVIEWLDGLNGQEKN